MMSREVAMRNSQSGRLPFSAAAVALFACLSASQHEPLSELVEATRRLRAGTRDDSASAAALLTEWRRGSAREIADALNASRPERSGAEECEVAVVARVAREWRLSEVRRELLALVDYRVMLRAGGKRDRAEYYPCAAALAWIGTIEVCESTVAELRKGQGARRAKLMAWVLYRAMGGDLSRAFLEQHARERGGEEAARLRQAAEDVTKGNALLAEADG